MVVGVIGPVLGALVIRRDLTKEAMVGTLGFFGFLGNLLKIIGFTVIGFSFSRYGSLILGMMPAAIVGAWAGRRLLARVDQRLFLVVFHVVLVALALEMILIDGIAALLAR